MRIGPPSRTRKPGRWGFPVRLRFEPLEDRLPPGSILGLAGGPDPVYSLGDGPAVLTARDLVPGGDDAASAESAGYGAVARASAEDASSASGVDGRVVGSPLGADPTEMPANTWAAPTMLSRGTAGNVGLNANPPAPLGWGVFPGVAPEQAGVAAVSPMPAAGFTAPVFDTALMAALAGQGSVGVAGSPPPAARNFGGLPVSFQANVGQTDPRVRFVSEGNGYTLFLTGNEAVFSLRGPSSAARGDIGGGEESSSAVFRMELAGASPDLRPVGVDRLPGVVNHFVGSDPARWHAGVPTFGRVEYPGVYPGVDLVYYGGRGGLEYDFTVAPGADPGQISLRFSGAEGISLDADGSLVVQTAAGAVRQHRPVLYQNVNGGRREVVGTFVRQGPDRVGFAVGGYDPSRALVIDPVLSYSTFLGGSGAEEAYGLAVDGQGAMYVTGETTSTDFPTTDGTTGDGVPHVYVAAIDPTGQSVLYATYLAGSSRDRGNAVAVDVGGNVYVTGRTNSRDFPIVAGAFQSIYPGGMYSAFVTKIAPGGGLVYSTYLGGSRNDNALAVAVDAAGNAYVAGGTGSVDFPVTPNAFQYVTENTAPFFTELNAAGSDLLYSSFIGGGMGMERANGIALDAQGNVYITGQTTAVDFPTLPDDVVQLDYGGGLEDAFVAEFNPNASGDASLVYATYLGGSGDDRGLAVAVDAAGNAFVTGETSSPDFPVVNPFQPAYQGFIYNAFVAEIAAGGTRIVFASYLGGSQEDRGLGIALDAADNVYLTGYTTSPDFPTQNPIQPSLGGGSDAFVAEVSADGSGLVFSTFLGGSGDENADTMTIPHDGGIAVDAAGAVYVLGKTGSADFPTVNPLQASLNGSTDAFLVKITP